MDYSEFKLLDTKKQLGDRFEHFQSLDSFEKSSLEIGLSTFRVLIVLRNHLMS